MIVREREREAETQGEGEAGSMHREPDVGFDPGSPGSHPGLQAQVSRIVSWVKGGTKLLSHPGCLIPLVLLNKVYFYFFKIFIYL